VSTPAILNTPRKRPQTQFPQANGSFKPPFSTMLLVQKLIMEERKTHHSSPESISNITLFLLKIIPGSAALLVYRLRWSNVEGTFIIA
jgi:hypothetical protein